jgi:hypothetical protein
LYISLTTRPDITTAVSAVGRYAENPGTQHWNALLQIVLFLKGTKSRCLPLGGVDNLNLNSYCDNDWGGDIDTRRSQSGYVIFLGNVPIKWSSKLQTLVATSTTEAEYIALATLIQELLWCKAFMEEFGYEQDAIEIKEDNAGCIKNAENPGSNARTKHIDIRYFFIKHHVIETKEFLMVKVKSVDMIADMFTKQLAYRLFEKHRIALGLKDL